MKVATINGSPRKSGKRMQLPEIVRRGNKLLAAVLVFVLLCAYSVSNPNISGDAKQQGMSQADAYPTAAADLSGLYQVPENAVQDIRHRSEEEPRFSEKPLAMDGYTIYRVKTDRELGALFRSAL